MDGNGEPMLATSDNPVGAIVYSIKEQKISPHEAFNILSKYAMYSLPLLIQYRDLVLLDSVDRSKFSVRAPVRPTGGQMFMYAPENKGISLFLGFRKFLQFAFFR